MAKYIVVGNWKMNPGTPDEAKKIARKVRRAITKLSRIETVICPPLPFIAMCSPRRPVKNFHVGVQSVSFENDSGAHTGEVSAVMLREAGAEYAIIGHSEQRKRGDTDEIVSKRLKMALEAGLTAVVCVGETVRDENGDYLKTLKEQIKNSFADVQKKYAKNIIVAYEPVWAVGAREAMRPEQIHEMSLFVKKVFADIFTPEVGVKTAVLYGGAVTFRNAPDIMTIGKVDGLLVGRESVNAAGFVELLKAVDGIT